MSERNSVRTCFGACAAGSSIAIPIGKHAFASSSSPLQFHDRAGAFWGKVRPRLIGRKSFLLRKAINIDCQILTYVEELRWVARIMLARRPAHDGVGHAESCLLSYACRLLGEHSRRA